MKQNKYLEAFVGLFVVISILGISFLAFKVSKVNSIDVNDSYQLYGDFNSVSGLKKGATVTMAGVKIGKVNSIELIDEQYTARVSFLISNKYKLPIDTSASVLTAGLLGEKYLGLDAGADDETLADGDEIDLTKSSVVLERLIDKFFLNSTKK